MAATACKPLTTEFGRSCPPEGPHTVTVHFGDWDKTIRFRNGDMSLFSELKSLYPRFTPFGPARQLSAALGARLGAQPGRDGVLMFLHPATFAAHIAYSKSPLRGDNALADGDLTFRVVDVHGVRLYCVVYPVAKTPGTIGIWQDAGVGVSTRLAEDLLPHVDDLTIVDWSGDLDSVPSSAPLPEVDSHAKLRRRIRDLLHRAPLDPAKIAVEDDDVRLYQTGMAAIYRLHEALTTRDPTGTVLVLGAVFHNTWHLFEEHKGGMKHFGACDAASSVMDKVEAFLEEHYAAAKTVSYVFLEFPSNPLLVSADLRRLRQIADKYSIPVVIDDTISSFANVDVLPMADLLITSLTKSFSGYADVMAGSVVLNPQSPSYESLSPIFASLFRNELSARDADVLLANSEDYLARTIILNRNAAAMAKYLAKRQAEDEDSPISAVLYPTTNDTQANYDTFLRPSTPSLPSPGHGCLLSVDFRTSSAAATFYDSVPFHRGPHLGAHRTLAVPLNALVFGKMPDVARYHATYGARAEQIRLSAGLEDEDELIAGLAHAVDRTVEVHRSGVEVGLPAVGLPPSIDGDAVVESTAPDAAKDKVDADVKVEAKETTVNFE